MLLIFVLLLFFQEENARASVWDIGGILGGLASLILALKWIGDYFSKKRSDKKDLDLKRMELEDKAEDEKERMLLEKIEELRQEIIDLNTQVFELKRFGKEQRTLREKCEQQLQSINTAFDIVYLALEDYIGKDQKGARIMKVLEKHIKNGSSNITSAE